MSGERPFRLVLSIVLIGFVAYRARVLRKHRACGASPLAIAAGGGRPLAATLLAVPASAATLAWLIEPSWMAWSGLPLPGWLRWAGAAAGLSGFALLIAAQRALGERWSETPRLIEGHALATGGPYRCIRHPIYAAFLIIFGSTLPISANGIIGALWIAMTVVEVVLRIRREEALLTSRFGEPYRLYAAARGRLLPKIRSATNVTGRGMDARN